MTRAARAVTVLALAVAAAGCTSLAPPVPVADPAIPSAWPTAPTAQVAGAAAQPSDLGWRDFFADPALNLLVGETIEPEALPMDFGASTKLVTALPPGLPSEVLLQANLDAARAEQDIALAQYERAVQAAFRDAADALALSGTLADQLAAQQALVDAAERANALSKARYLAGRDSYLAALDAQRTLFASQQSLVATRLAELTNRVTLYKVLGGGVREVTE